MEDALTIAYFRGLLAGKLAAEAATEPGRKSIYPGAMLAVGAAPSVVEKHMENIDSERGSP